MLLTRPKSDPVVEICIPDPGQSGLAITPGLSNAYGSTTGISALRMPTEEWILTTAWCAYYSGASDNASHNIIHTGHVAICIGPSGVEKVIAEFPFIVTANITVTTSTGMSIFIAQAFTAPLLPVRIPSGSRLSGKAKVQGAADAPVMGVALGGYLASSYPEVSPYPDQFAAMELGAWPDGPESIAPLYDFNRRSLVYPSGKLDVTPATAAFGAWAQVVAPGAVPYGQLILGLGASGDLSAATGWGTYEIGLGPAGQEIPYSRLVMPRMGTIGPAAGLYYLPRPLVVPPNVGVNIRIRQSAGTVAQPVVMHSWVIP